MNTTQEHITAAEAANKSGNYAEAEKICRAAIAGKVSKGEKTALLAVLAEALLNLGEADKALKAAQESLRLAELQGEASAQARAMYILGIMAFRESNFSEALEKYNQAQYLYRTVANLEGIALCLGSIGSAYRQMSDFAKAIDYIRQSLSSYELLDDEDGVSRQMINLSNVYRQIGEYQEAIENLLKALAIQEKLANSHRVAIIYGNLGSVYAEYADYHNALIYFQKSLGEHRKNGNKSDVAMQLGNIGNIYREMSDYKGALEHFHQALAMCEEEGMEQGKVHNLGNIANVYRDLSDFQQSITYFEKALHYHTEHGNKSQIAHIQGNLGAVYAEMDDYATALKYLQKALLMLKKLGDKRGIAINLVNIGLVFFDKKQYKEALFHYQKSLEIFEEIGEQRGIALNFANIGSLFAEKDFADYDAEKAEANLLRSIDLLEKLELKKELYEQHLVLAELYEQEERLKEAIFHLKEYQRIEQEVQNEEIKNLADKFTYEQNLAVVEKERQTLELASYEVMKAYSELDAEKERSDALLLNILPATIAERIKKGERMIADPFDSVSIFFADLVGFTTLSSQVSPSYLIKILNSIFVAIDRCALAHGVEKIKTIGDSYMAVSGLPIADETHALKMAQFAMEVLEKVKAFQNDFKEFNIAMRIGIHCGPVVAGVIGEHKFSYDIWGDSVNIASRMESYGEPSKVHISEDFKNALSSYPEFTFIPREPIEIKGKGFMNTYFLQ